MKIFIPEIGTKLRLEETWSFRLYSEYRNTGAFARLHGDTEYKVDAYGFKHTTESKIHTWKAHTGQTYKNVYQAFTYELTEDRMLIPTVEKNKGWRHEPITKEVQESLAEREIPSFLDWWKESFLPVGTILTVDRIYIRKGAQDFSSLSFWAQIPMDKKRFRFWAKLSDVNEIECTVLDEKEIINALAESSKNRKAS